MELVQLTQDVHIAFAAISDVETDAICDLDAAGLAVNCVARRRSEFVAGRSLARSLFEHLGLDPQPIPLRGDRLPEWPVGVVACISHTDTLVAVAVTVAPQVRSVGLDIEMQDRANEDLAPQIMLPSESRIQGEREITDYFSAKEAVFKACFPLHHEYFNFTDIELHFVNQAFTARPRAQLCSAATVKSGRGYTSLIGDHVLSLFVVDVE